jgi:RimJ/RimL family protein N-acetyltransferase
MNPIPHLTTGRIHLRELYDEDVTTLHSILTNPSVLRYFPSPNSPSLVQVGKLIERQQAHWQEHGYGWWALALHSTDGLIGWCGLNFLPETDEVELKYLLAEEHWGKGIATEASRVSLKYGFSQTDIEQVIGIVHPENLASQRVLEKAGMSFLGQALYFGMKCYRYAIDRKSFQTGIPGEPDSRFQVNR